MANTEVYSFKVAGISYREDAVIQLISDNDDYRMSKKEIVDNCMEDEPIYRYEFNISQTKLLPDPNNEYDHNAIKIIMDGEHIGYVPKNKCMEVREILNTKNIKAIKGYISGGKYKILTGDGIETDTDPYFASVDIIYYQNSEDALSNNDLANSSRPAAKNKKRGLHTFLLTMICLFGAVVIAAIVIYVLMRLGF